VTKDTSRIRSASASRQSGVRLTALGRDGGATRAEAPRGVLVLESEGSCLAAWLKALGELGVPVASARDASAARGASGVAVIVLGGMPAGQDAIALARELRARPADDRPRILLVSRDEVRRVDRVHVDAFLLRPLPIDVLVTHVRRLLSLAGRTAAGVRKDDAKGAQTRRQG
jgi:DNA-binding response OmpR family regulator